MPKRKQDNAVAEAQRAIHTELTPSLVWVKTKDEHGVSHSVLLKPDMGVDQLERIRAALHDIPAIPHIEPPRHSQDDLLTLIPIADVHFGMRAWAREAGENYDSKKARSRLTEWVASVVAASPASGLGVILVNGDLLHMNDDKAQTPKSKHALDVDNRIFMTLETTIEALCVCIETAMRKFPKVQVILKPGNHDPVAYMAVLFAISERYRDNRRVEVEKEPSEFWSYQFGKVMLAAHHGDKARAERIVLYLADQYPKIWGSTRYRYLWTGHMHHHKSQDIGGVHWEQSRAITNRDAYAASHAYSGRPELQAVTYHKDKGEITRSRVTI